jgi:glycosyltransferase involved in cell wall biosynthesis
MNVLMVTPHLPPYQAANALLPHLLGGALEARGDRVRYLTFGSGPDSATIRYVRRRGRRLRATRLPQLVEALETWAKARALVRASDVVHVHSNTLMGQVAAGAALRAGRPYLLTHYGTEIWHHDGKDARFRRLNQRAAAVAYYSEALRRRGAELGLEMRRASVLYPPVAEAFRRPTPEARAAARARFGGPGLLLLNVKRLHPLADHATLLDAFARVRAARPDALLLIAGTGETEVALREQARRLSLGQEALRFLGLVPNQELAGLQGAADLFVLSSRLEATPTVALEALASGTPVVSTDNPGGVELNGMFGDDVCVVPRAAPAALAQAILDSARAPRRTRPASSAIVEQRFRLPGVAARYAELYAEACGR